MGTLPLGAALKRGGLVAAANWPVVLIDFGIESLFKLAVSVPILGGALMVSALVGHGLSAVMAAGISPTADLVLGSLANAPVALFVFLAAVAVTAVGAEALMVVVKSGTLAVVVEADRVAGEIQSEPFDGDVLGRANQFGLEVVVAGARHFVRRSVVLAVVLGAVYCAVGLAYTGVITSSPRSDWALAWPVVVLLATSVGIVSITAINLASDLLRVVMVTDDCSVRVAIRRLRRFMIEDARQVLGIFGVMAAVELVANAFSLLATAGLAPIAYLPVVGLIMVPLQAAVWLLRGILFQGLSLASLAAYQTQYRRFSRVRWVLP